MPRLKFAVLVVSLSAVLSPSLFAQPPAGTPTPITGTPTQSVPTPPVSSSQPATQPPQTNETPPGQSGSATAQQTLKNDFGFGVALGLSTKVTGADQVNSATIDANGIVRVNTRDNTQAGFMLETHYYIWPRPPAIGDDGNLVRVDKRSWGTGPFVAAQPGSAQIISAVGAGWMVGFRRPKGSTPSGFGLGLGYEAIPAAQVLGSEFVDGQKAPVDSSGKSLPIRYETQDKGALLVVLSVAF